MTEAVGVDFLRFAQGAGFQALAGPSGACSTANRLLQNNLNPMSMRPFVGRDGRSYYDAVATNGKIKPVPMAINTGLLRREDWKEIDSTVVKVARKRLRAVSDLRTMGLTRLIRNGMGRTTLETATQSDTNPASVSMDGLSRSNFDRPSFALANLPLPIIHKDFQFSLREILASRNGGSPLDMTMLEESTRKVAEMAEQMLIGNSAFDQYQHDGGTIYGYTDHPNRNTQTFTSPALTAWTPQTFLNELLTARDTLQDDNFFGPYMIYTAPSWDIYLDDDWSSSKGDITLRRRIEMIEDVRGVRRLDYLDNYDLIMVQMETRTIRLVVGSEIVTVQWEIEGGMAVNFKVMAILVPQLRADQDGQMGLLHGSV